MKIRCAFCNFETTSPWHGKVFDCLGECYSTYTVVKKDEDLQRVKMRLCEIFFLDDQYNISISPGEIERRCEFKSAPLSDGEYILFAREHRLTEDEIEKLKNATTEEIIVGLDALERLNAAMERFHRDLKDSADPAKLLNDVKVVEKLVGIIREKIELSL